MQVHNWCEPVNSFTVRQKHDALKSQCIVSPLITNNTINESHKGSGESEPDSKQSSRFSGLLCQGGGPVRSEERRVGKEC